LEGILAELFVRESFQINNHFQQQINRPLFGQGDFMTKKFISLPEEIFVYREQDRDCSSYLLANEDIVEAVETASEEPVVIGTYKLVHEAKYAIDKTVTEL